IWSTLPHVSPPTAPTYLPTSLYSMCCSLLPLFLWVPAFVFYHLQPLLPKSVGVGTPRKRVFGVIATVEGISGSGQSGKLSCGAGPTRRAMHPAALKWSRR